VSGGRIVALCALVFVAPHATACTASTLRTHAHAASVSRASLDLGATLGEAACAPERSAQMARAGDTAEAHEAHVEACLAVKGTHGIAVAAWVGYVGAVLSAATTGRTELADMLAWATRFAATYAALADALRVLGVDAPGLPPALGGVR
jgi:hypothetical protein